MAKKKCTKCSLPKEPKEFRVARRLKSGRRAQCRACDSLIQKNRYANDPEYRERITVQSRQWVKKNKARSRSIKRKWQLENAELKLAMDRAWFAANKDKIYVSRAVWNAANPNKLKTYQRTWVAANPLKKKASDLRRRARVFNADGVITDADIKAVVYAWDDKCWVCYDPYEAIDHVVALARGGSNLRSNLRPICKPCNSSKGVKMPTPEWLFQRRVSLGLM